MKKKVLITIGTRPEITRLKKVINELEKLCELEILHTGQHYSENMSGNFFKELNIKDPNINLAIQSSTPASQIGEIITKTESAINELKPDTICVYGDTNSSLAVALAANKMQIKLCHIEAGCRSFDFRMPEEYNRIIIDHISDLLICVSEYDHQLLLQERIHGKKVMLGDPSYDLFLASINHTNNKILTINNLSKTKFAFVTIHRAENVDKYSTLSNITEILNLIQESGIQVYFTMHPRTKKMFKSFGLTENLHNKIIVTDPVGYFDSITLQSHASLIVTDSGGVQKEAFYSKTPCLTIRQSTEHQDTIRLKANYLIDPNIKSDLSKVEYILNNLTTIRSDILKITEHPYGTGDAAKQIADYIIKY